MTETRAPLASLVTVGNELLYGQTVDTNAAWLGRSLAQLGFRVTRTFTVGDDPGPIQAAVGSAMEDADLVLVSGGLGPTPDDLTKAAVAQLLGREIGLDEELLQKLAARFRAAGYDRLPTPNRSQAEVPQGSIVLNNPQGTAPGLGLETDSCLVVMLPGVPRELRSIFEGDLTHLLRRRFARRLEPVQHRTIHTTGVPESRLSELVSQLLPRDMGPVSLAFLPDLRGVDLRLTARGVAIEEGEAWLTRIEAALEPVVSKWRFEAESGDVAEALNHALAGAGMTVATAESCTGGLVAKRITDRPGSSEVFVGGVIAYADAVKLEQLGVSPEDLREHGAVSEPVALQMAKGVRERFGASAGVGITGVAGPEGGTPEKPVGTVWIALAVADMAEARLVRLPGDRDAVRERAAQAVLGWLHRKVSGREQGR
ncbi:MAG: competence/damage-inducible protein A [Gemmatimonadota bacterium]|nr:competence/damage-inducible protein A [Gemmatimonadota bacterium]